MYSQGTEEIQEKLELEEAVYASIAILLISLLGDVTMEMFSYLYINSC